MDSATVPSEGTPGAVGKSFPLVVSDEGASFLEANQMGEDVS